MAVFRMARPMRRKGSSKEQFRVRIPKDVLEAARGQEIVLTIGDASVVKRISPKAVEIGLSLGTSDPSEVKLRQAAVLHQVGQLFAGLRQRQAPASLTHEQCVRLAGDFYRAWTDGGPDAGTLAELEPDELEEAWKVTAQRLGDAVERGYERAIRGLRRLAERFLLARGMSVDERSLDRLCDEIVKALRDAATTNAGRAAGDYSEGGGLGERFGKPWRPEAEVARGRGENGRQPGSPGRSGSGKAMGAVSMRSLVQRWRDDPQTASSPATHSAYLAAIERFIAFVGHDDAKLVTPSDVLGFRKERLKQVSPKTVRDGDLAAFKSIFGWAVQEQLLDGPNPAATIQVKVPKAKRSRADKGFTDEEAIAILRHAFLHKRGRAEKAKTAAAKRWVPWLMAYSGARVGEIAQLRKEDIHWHATGFWFMRLTPEAGTIKTGTARDVPVHSHLIEQGFVADFVEKAPEGHLFFDPARAVLPERPVLRRKPVKGQPAKLRGKPKGLLSRTDDPRGILGPLQGIKNRLQEFVREVVKDPEVQPQHAWRHRVKSVAFSVGIQERVIDELQGHASRHEGGKYGAIGLETKREAVERLPRYAV